MYECIYYFDVFFFFLDDDEDGVDMIDTGSTGNVNYVGILVRDTIPQFDIHPHALKSLYMSK